MPQGPATSSRMHTQARPPGRAQAPRGTPRATPAQRPPPTAAQEAARQVRFRIERACMPPPPVPHRLAPIDVAFPMRAPSPGDAAPCPPTAPPHRHERSLRPWHGRHAPTGLDTLMLSELDLMGGSCPPGRGRDGARALAHALCAIHGSRDARRVSLRRSLRALLEAGPSHDRGAGVRQLYAALAQLPRLELLDLSRNGTPTLRPWHLLPMAPLSFATLTGLDVSRTACGYAELARALPAMPQLRRLIARDVYPEAQTRPDGALRMAELQTLLSALSLRPGLEALSVGPIGLSVAVASEFARCMGAWPRLRALRLGFEPVATLASAPSLPLAEDPLDVTRPAPHALRPLFALQRTVSADAWAASVLWGGVAAQGMLEQLELDGMPAAVANSGGLARAVQAQQRLLEIGVPDSALSPIGALGLLAALASRPLLERIDLRGVHLTESSLVALELVACSAPRLRRVRLLDAPLGAGGPDADARVRALRQHTSPATQALCGL